MFGGLEVKGSSSNDKKEENKPQSSSGFSFLSVSSTPASAGAQSSSGFAVMGSDASTAVEPLDQRQETSTSGFSFLGTGAKAEPTANTSSGFGFLQTANSASPLPPPVDTAPSSSFDFLAKEREPPGRATGTQSLSPTDSEPVGSGIVFGGATGVATKKPIKKRSRAQKVGVARAAELPSPTSTAPPRPSYPSSPPRPQPAPSALAAPEDASNTKDAAQEAVRRAEEFIAQKSTQPSYGSSVYVEDYGATPATPSASTTTIWAKSPEDDDDYAAAKAAAKEAKAQMTSRLGGIFSRKTPWGSSSTAATTSSSSHSIPSMHETPAERMQREQEEIKRAMAERHLIMQQDEPSASEISAPVVMQVEGDNHSPAVATNASDLKTFETASAATPRSSWTRPTVTASPPAPPPKPKTSAEKLEELLSVFEDKVKEAMDRVARLRDQRNMLLDERLLSLAKERLATQTMAAAEAQQMAAAEAEDYDLADRLAAVIEGHSRERAELASILDNIGRALGQLESQKEEVVGGVALCFEQVKQELELFQGEQKSNDKKDDTESMARFAATSKQLSAENSRLLSDAKHLERDEKLVAEERKDLEISISGQTADMEKQRDSARARLVSIEEEIEILRRQLEAKESTAAGLRAEVSSFENDISKVRGKFSRQVTRVERKEASVKENRHEWEKEKIAYESMKLAHEEEVKSHSEALLAHDALMEKLKKEITLAGTFESIVAKEVVFENSVDQDLEADEDFAQLQADVVKCEAGVSEGRQILKAAESLLKNLKEERDELLERIPVLEEMKSSAAARRDFKTAGKASKQIKDATSRLKECQEELSGEAAERKEAALEELIKLEEELKAKQAIANEKEREGGQAAMKKVAEKIRRLAETKKKVCDRTTEETGIKAIGAFVLSGQIKALLDEGSAYGSKFGGWDDIVKELADSGVIDAVAPNESSEANDDSHVKVGSPTKRPDDEIDDEVIAKFREVTKRLQEAEAAIDAAVAEEAFETAAELDEILEGIKNEWQAIDLTDAEAKLFLDTNDAGSCSEDLEVNEAASITESEEQLKADDEKDETEGVMITAEVQEASEEKRANDTNEEHFDEGDQALADGRSASEASNDTVSDDDNYDTSSADEEEVLANDGDLEGGNEHFEFGSSEMSNDDDSAIEDSNETIACELRKSRPD